MPLYLCNSVSGALHDEEKQRISREITRVHCAHTGAPEKFVHAFFLENAADHPLFGRSVCLTGNIRAGRTEAQKEAIAAELTAEIVRHSTWSEDDVLVRLTDTPASWVMEGGEIFPEPGEESDWLKRHEQRGATLSQK